MNESWIIAEIRALISQHYGMPMVISILSRDEHSLQRLTENPRVSYYDQLIGEWSCETGPCIDLVTWDHTTESLQLVQTLCFRDAYVSYGAWVYAVRNLVRDSSSLWVVRHIE